MRSSYKLIVIMLKRTFASRAGHLGVTLLLFYFSTCCSLKCRTEDGLSESELKRITRNCMRKIGESTRTNNGGSQAYSNNHNHYGPLHQSNFGAQYGGNSRYDHNYDYDDDDNDQYNGNGNNNNYNNNNNNYNNNKNGNNNYDRDRDHGNRNVLQQRSRDRQQNGNSDNGRSSSAVTSSSGNNNNNNNGGGRYDNSNNGKSNGGSSGSGGGSGNSGAGGGSGGRNSGSGGSEQRGHTQSSSNNNNSNNNNNKSNNNNNKNKNANNDTVDMACVVHCFFEELNMLNSDDYPDRYKVQYGLTRDLRDRELRNFYTDTIQDCFHYLESQRRRDKCHYSRDLINCMTEYAKVNCDDWQQFNMVFN